MRNITMLAIAAGLALPTAAQAQQGRDRGDSPRAEARAEQRDLNRGAAVEAAWEARTAAREAQQAQQRREDRQDARQDRREDRQDARDDRRDDRRDARQDQRTGYNNGYRDARQDYRQDRREDRRDARQDRRQNYRDWRAYRQADRNAFRRGAYYAPRGYSYRRVSVGQQLLANAFWGQRYWVDPYDYYLPQPRYGYQRWIRYGNDVLLIDTRNGRVLVVYNSFFW